uniref:Uncharacterized protein n=1 Tax=Globodera rostochiensis TaxID=31243 RepID=A0A914I5Q4_GLORO
MDQPKTTTNSPSCSNSTSVVVVVGGGLSPCSDRAHPICPSSSDTIFKVSSRQPLTSSLDEDESAAADQPPAALLNKHGRSDMLTRSGKRWHRTLLALWEHRRTALIWLTPVLLAPLLHNGEQEYKCAFCAILMAVYWTCEVMPIGITALLPTVLFPVMGILTARDVSHEFLNDTNFLFIGGLVVASAVEKCGLHERVALRVLSLIGSEPRRVMLGFMLITAILSMFISNTATCAMMLPIGQSVILQFVSNSSDKNGNGCTRNGLIESDALTPEEAEAGTNNSASNGLMLKRLCSRDDVTSRMAKGLILSIAFGANIGGVGTPTGTASNLVLVGMLSTLFPDADTGVNYMSWMALTVPLMCCCLVACWAVLSLMFLRNVTLSADHHHVAEMMRMRAQALPSMSFAQKSVAGCFMLLLLLWIGRDPGFMPGLGALFPRDFYTDSTSVMAIAILLFLLPAENPLRTTGDNANNNNGTNSGKRSGGNGTTGKRLMDWPTMQKQFPWGVVLLLGGGFALAAGVKESGLSKLMANALGELDGQPGWVLQLICIVVIMLVTNICSNAVTASIFIPIVASMAQRAQLHPLALMLPTTLACSFAFVLPVGTPPNALAIGSGLLRVSDLMLSGLAVSAVSATLTIAYLATVAPLILPIDRFPEWAVQTVGNGTTDTVAEGIGLRLLDEFHRPAAFADQQVGHIGSLPLRSPQCDVSYTLCRGASSGAPPLKEMPNAQPLLVPVGGDFAQANTPARAQMLSGLAVFAVSATLTIAYLATVAPLIIPIARFPEWAVQTVGNGTTDTVAEGIGLRLLDEFDSSCPELFNWPEAGAVQLARNRSCSFAPEPELFNWPGAEAVQLAPELASEPEFSIGPKPELFNWPGAEAVQLAPELASEPELSIGPKPELFNWLRTSEPELFNWPGAGAVQLAPELASEPELFNWPGAGAVQLAPELASEPELFNWPGAGAVQLAPELASEPELFNWPGAGAVQLAPELASEPELFNWPGAGAVQLAPELASEPELFNWPGAGFISSLSKLTKVPLLFVPSPRRAVPRLALAFVLLFDVRFPPSCARSQSAHHDPGAEEATPPPPQPSNASEQQRPLGWWAFEIKLQINSSCHESEDEFAAMSPTARRNYKAYTVMQKSGFQHTEYVQILANLCKAELCISLLFLIHGLSCPGFAEERSYQSTCHINVLSALVGIFTGGLGLGAVHRFRWRTMLVMWLIMCIISAVANLLAVITTGIWLDHLSKLKSRTGIVNGLSGLMLLGSVLVGVCFILTSVIICHYWASNSAKYQAVGRMAKRMRSLRRRTSKPGSGTERVGRPDVASNRMGHYSGGRHSGGGAGGVGQCSTHYQMECQSGGSGGEQQHHHHHNQQQQQQQQLATPLPHASSQHYHRSPTPYEIV